MSKAGWHAIVSCVCEVAVVWHCTRSDSCVSKIQKYACGSGVVSEEGWRGKPKANECTLHVQSSFPPPALSLTR